MNFEELVKYSENIKQKMKDLDKKILWYDDIESKLPIHITLLEENKLEYKKLLSILSHINNIDIDYIMK